MTPRAEHTPAMPLPQAPAATRLRPASWRDPRLVAGVLVVALSVLGGALLLARADDTTVVWGVRRGLPVGATLAAGDLESRRVGLAGGDLTHYLPASADPPVGRVLQREVGAGELLPAGALASGGEESGVRVPLAVAVADLPSSVQVGTGVDVWVTGREEGTAVPADRAFSGVRVVGLTRDRDSFAPETVRSVVVLVPGVVAEDVLGRFLGQAAAGRVILTQAQGDPVR